VSKNKENSPVFGGGPIYVYTCMLLTIGALVLNHYGFLDMGKMINGKILLFVIGLILIIGIFLWIKSVIYADDRVGKRLSGVPDYVQRNRAAVLEMHRQVGYLVLDERGVARRGLVVRHLVLPGDLAGTAEVARFLADEVSTDTYVNVMDQYRPAREAARYPEICRRPAVAEYRAAVQEMLAAGLQRLDG
jgi:putative pyruvate formate lyase activating enzyme